MASVYNNMERASDALLGIKQAIVDKGIEIAEDTPVEKYGELIDSISSGGGGGISLEEIATGVEPSGDVVIEAETIAQGAFAYATNIKNVTLANATSLGSNAFYSSPIDSITMPKVATIGNSAFYMSRGMTSVTLPATLTSIGTSAFGYTTLKSVTFEGTPDSIATNAFTGSNSLTDIYVPWSEGEVANAPWGAKATIHYNSGVAT